MMSQIEIWDMQEYCSRKNEESKNKRYRGFSRISLLLIIAGMVLAVLSGCLIAYVVRLTVEMTGIYYLAMGIGGAVTGLGFALLGMIKSDIQ
ncbi:MAG: hypothetical protein Q4D99_02050 [Bacillota bacterium]|nr:hypothetical protein [Bacillota bacterium]